MEDGGGVEVEWSGGGGGGDGGAVSEIRGPGTAGTPTGAEQGTDRRAAHSSGEKRANNNTKRTTDTTMATNITLETSMVRVFSPLIASYCCS